MAARYFIAGGVNSNWDTSGNWSATDGGAASGVKPSASDDVFFTANSPACIVNTAGVGLTINFTGYTNTLTMTAGLTISGNVTLVAAMTISGASALTINAASTITSNGKTWPNAVTFSGANTKTLSGDLSITGLLTISAATIINSGTLNLAAGINHASATVGGTTVLNLTGGTWTGGAGSSYCSSPVTIGGNVTLATSVNLGAGASLTYNSGTVTTISSNLIINGSVTLDTAGIIFNNITVNGAATITNNSLWTSTGTFTINASVAVTFAGTAGFMFTNFSSLNIDARTLTLVNGVTYTIKNSFDASSGRKGGLLLITSNHASIKAILTLQNDLTICNAVASFTRIDASEGRPVNTFNGTITDCINVYAYTNVLYKPMASFNRGARRLGLSNKNKSVLYQ